MVIQRWQTVMLVVAVCLMGAFCSSSYGIAHITDTLTGAGSVTPLLVKDAPLYMAANLVIAVILFIAIFLYKNLKRQMTVTLISIVLICVSVVTCGIMLYTGAPDAEIEWTGGIFILLAALICALMAYNFMRKDKKLLSSYDRLR